MATTKWPLLSHKLALQLGFVALLIYTVLLPIQPFFPPITSGIVSFWLVYVLGFKRERLRLIFKNKIAILWICYYVFMLFGLAYTTNLAEANKDIVLKISLLLWPLAMASWPKLFEKYRQKILLVFAATTSIWSLIILCVAFFNWHNSGLPAEMFYTFTHASKWVPNHYMGLYASFSVLILIYNIDKKSIKLKLAAPMILVLLALLAAVSVRIQFLALPVAVFVFLLAMRKNISIKIMALLSGLAILIGAATFLVPTTRNRLLETVDEYNRAVGEETHKQTNHRYYIWQEGATVIAANFWLGTGTGAADIALNEGLKSCTAEFWNGTGTYTLAEKDYNYHNSFLQHWATHGIVGLILLLTVFIWPFFLKKRKFSPLALSFLALCAISFFTESMLERQAGVLFFGFMYGLFFVAQPVLRQSEANGK